MYKEPAKSLQAMVKQEQTSEAGSSCSVSPVSGSAAVQDRLWCGHALTISAVHASCLLVIFMLYWYTLKVVVASCRNYHVMQLHTILHLCHNTATSNKPAEPGPTELP